MGLNLGEGKHCLMLLVEIMFLILLVEMILPVHSMQSKFYSFRFCGQSIVESFRMHSLHYKADAYIVMTWLTCLKHSCLNPIALRKTKIVNSFGLSECNRVKQ